MRYEITPTTVTFFLENEKSSKPSAANVPCADTPLSHENVIGICDAALRQNQSKRSTTQRNYIYQFVRPIFAFANLTNSALPSTSDAWQLFLLHFFQFYLTDTTWSGANATSRMSSWSTCVISSLEFWVAEEIIPSGVLIPEIKLKKIGSHAASQRILGETHPAPTAIEKEPQKLLVNVDFSLSEAQYLEVIEKRCREKIELIKNVCIEHWDALMLDGVRGDQFAASIPESKIATVRASGNFSEQLRGGSKTPLASSTHPHGHLWAISLSKQMLRNGDAKDCISTDAHRQIDFFSKKVFKAHGYPVLANHTAMPQGTFNNLSGYAQYCRFVRVLSQQDAAVACCLLTIEHPEFTSDSLQSARLLNSRGKSHLILTDNGESSILSLDKPRAGRRIKAALTPLAQKVIADVIAWTAQVRAVLKKAGDKAWRFLFLGYGRSGQLIPLSPTARYLNEDKIATSLNALYPTLKDHGLITGVFDYRRIRSTMGVLRWFETGSIQAMSQRLGNSYKVVLGHYLPPTLLHAWNTRIIRRFQNTLIVLAAFDEDYLLDVTDFSSLSDLQHFIAQLVLEYPSDSSPLAKEVQMRLRTIDGNNEGSDELEFCEGVLNVRLSKKSLSFLYAFSDFAVEKFTDDALRRRDSQTMLAPIQLVDLARLIRHACENEETSASISELLDLQKLRHIHHGATAEQFALSKRFKEFSIEQQWEATSV